MFNLIKVKRMFKPIFYLVIGIVLISVSLTAIAQKDKDKKPTNNRNITVPGVYKEDSDQDGVPNVRDKCPNTPRGIQVDEFGCPPDRDGDGIYDYLDECPDIPGIPLFKGCPDTDGDGIPDKDDLCPDVPGPKYNRGCPEKAREEDRDKDGTFDKDDLCPETPGPRTNRGCPEVIKQEEKVILEKASRVLFETAKAEIKPVSFPILDELVALLKKYPNSYINLEGHTDSEGEEEANMILSNNRANAVRQYLINKGIEPHRIEAKGFGETRPIDTNATPEGRQRNRRVEMNIISR
ncbi:MAG: OmpA family protein [Microscillaceae bacterium]|nr:OmpA family protein [Microscillaceae bacterium]MDW8461521.1 OmpA family protein [Cytophagales bacterium]